MTIKELNALAVQIEKDHLSADPGCTICKASVNAIREYASLKRDLVTVLERLNPMVKK